MSLHIQPMSDQACLIVHGPDQPGIVAAVAALVTRNKGNIVTLDQYSDDPTGGDFFQRVVFNRPGLPAAMPQIEADLKKTLEPLKLEWILTDQSIPKRMAILVSTSDHCLLELLWRHRRGELPVIIPMVISNHTNTAEDVRSFGVPFFHIPSQGPDKAAAEAEILKLLAGNVDFVVLARYMQIVSEDFCSRFPERLINIHHSFLPAFVGANPYQAAHDRGVKLIGATAHYVTAELDAGPIIEQEVARVDHRATVEDMRRVGRYVERQVLAQAVTWHVEDRVIVEGPRTIVFA